ncbi:hypothetical protein AYJ66_16905 [Dietzia cinnamea]|uniref:sensor histidine kinase n=1 Tax=Dietzia massiliensis TaxID=2697499 RepID=UPI0007C801D9|nr:ATP-binding protein [Dietzia massiliensis]MBS7549382.1 ATP-binding protein [Dietzia massiliensis]OAH45482.1 hypothetical protein AYJ66_16905 [Dietzia cinnamea]
MDVHLATKPTAELSSVLVRVVQEALTNAVKHGVPERITITLSDSPATVTVEVTDDGRGFDASVPRTAASFGLEGMTRRVNDLGGTLSVRSRVGEGTLVRAVLPTIKTEDQE